MKDEKAVGLNEQVDIDVDVDVEIDTAGLTVEDVENEINATTVPPIGTTE